MGEEVSRRLAHRPEAVFWKEQVRVKYVCPGCAKITRPVLPPAPIEKSLADTSLLADLLLSKYYDHLPLSRLEAIYSRSGVELSKSTLGSWIGAVTDDALLGAIAEAVGKDVCSRSLAQTDETGILVLDRQHPEGRFNGRMWVFRGRTGELFYSTRRPRRRSTRRPGSLTFAASSWPTLTPASTGSLRTARFARQAATRTPGGSLRTPTRPSRAEPRRASLGAALLQPDL